ncbi:MAG TPA: tetratricopeptide repeat protein [Egibacteraceae bacterium]|nr:tetratricopeptide repeat protein [Egibacteraceae bacterium]
MGARHNGASGSTGPHILTFLFTDIEGSTRLLERLGAGYQEVLAAHHRILNEAIQGHGGSVQRTEGDSFFATFTSPAQALTAAIEAQRQLASHPWPSDVELRVRMGLHTGEAVVISDELVGLDIHRAARIMGVAWGGQVLVSSVTKDLLSGVDEDISLRDLGRHRLKDLAEAERIFQATAPGLASDFPALRSLDATPNNLPVQVTSFVGRQREIAEAVDLLARTRALTLTGPGGTGKTRLSLQVAAEAAEAYPDGVFFVPLAGVSDPVLVMSAVAGVLGLTPAGDRTPLDMVIDHLQSRRALLVLDNFEQVADAAIDISKLLSAARDVTVLVTSRVALRLSGEQEYPVPPLPLPLRSTDTAAVAASDAAALFVARAAAVQPSFRITADNAAAVAEIIRRLDGLPLAIELAAARIRLLPPHAIAARLGDALDLLSAGARDLPDRQRTLRGAIAWSYDLLRDPARRLFARCSAFRGGVGFEQLSEVCEPGLDADLFETLSELVEHSLVRRLEGSGETRFAMLETIREYAAEQLAASGERDDIRRRHAAAFLALAEQASPLLTEAEAPQWLDRLGRDHDNLRAALHRAAEDGDTATALRLVACLWRFWQIRGHLHEGRREADRVLALSDALEHPAELAAAHEAAGGMMYWQGDLDASRRCYSRALELYREQADESAVARGLYNLAFAHSIGGGPEAMGFFEQALDTYERLGDELGVARVHWGLMSNAWTSRDYETMREHGNRCIPVFRAAGGTFDLAWALHMQGTAEFALGDYDAARALFVEALEMFTQLGDASAYHLVLADFAFLAEATGDPERALRLLGAVARLSDETGAGLLEPQLDRYPRRTPAEGLYDAERVEALKAEGYAMTRDDAIAYALQA